MILTDRKTGSHFPPEPVSAAGLEGDAEATLPVNKTRDVRIDIIHSKYQGRRFMEPRTSVPSRDLTPESLRGSPQTVILPSVLPAARLRAPVGLHRFEPVYQNEIAPVLGQCYLPDKEFRYLRTVIVTAAVYRGFDQELRPRLAVA